VERFGLLAKLEGSSECPSGHNMVLGKLNTFFFFSRCHCSGIDYLSGQVVDDRPEAHSYVSPSQESSTPRSS
jgi:hypothetical protein